MNTASNPRFLCADPLAIAIACIISLLFARSIHHYLGTSKRNTECSKTESVVAFHSPDDSFPEDRPDAWRIEQIITFKKFIKIFNAIPVTFDIHQDYSRKLRGYFYRLSLPPAWLPSIPVAHRKLII
jgi:hypothetical protein